MESVTTEIEQNKIDVAENRTAWAKIHFAISCPIESKRKRTILIVAVTFRVILPEATQKGSKISLEIGL